MKRIATLSVLVAMTAPGTAAAQGTSSTCQAYNTSQLCQVVHSGQSSNSDGTLPFTGLDVALLAAGGGGLLGTGLLVRRLSSSHS